MAEINLAINGRPYGISCDDGQEQRVSALGRYVDERLREISRAGAASNESHLLVLTALVLADEIYETRENMQEIQAAMQQGTMSEADERQVVNSIERIIGRIDAIAERFQAA